MQAEPVHPNPLSPELAAVATSMAVDAVAAEVTVALAAAGIPAVLLRGPSIVKHLYAADAFRAYGDTDLLVSSEARVAAGDILRSLGFFDETGLGRRHDDQPVWATAWRRSSDGGSVDLHWTLVGVQAEPSVTWEVLRGHAESLNVARRKLDGLDASATAFVVALHAAQHGLAFPGPLRDLELALTRLERETWLTAAHLADQLCAKDAFSAGLRLHPYGAVLADQLALPKEPSVEVRLRAASPPPMALGFDWLARIPGVRSKLRFIVGKLVPEPSFVRVWFPAARNGSNLALVLGYLWRPIWLVKHAPSGLRAWRAARTPVRNDHPRA